MIGIIAVFNPRYSAPCKPSKQAKPVGDLVLRV
jgi:hypothetical protein